jgi:ribosomal protein S18 acetylase RimI-like enzyme
MSAATLLVERLHPPVADEDRVVLEQLEQASQLRPAGWDALAQEIMADPTLAVALVARVRATSALADEATGEAPERGRVVGFASARRMGDAAHVVRLVVSVDHRRAGLGARLLDGLRVWADGIGCMTLTLEVRADNAPALALYRRAGLAEVGRRTGYYPDGEDAIICTLLGPLAPLAPQTRT